MVSRLRRLLGLRSSAPRRAPTRGSWSSLARRILYFWVVWSGLLMVHESGHVFGAFRADQQVERMTVGVGPRVWSGAVGETSLELRLVPIVGLTEVTAGPATRQPVGWPEWRRDSVTMLGGVLATLGVAAALATLVGGGERITRRRWWLGRFVIADALVLTVFNFLPVPPLDGGRALLGAVSAWHGGPLERSALFWIQLGGFALAVVPMALWTRWTAGIDRAAMLWGAPRPRSRGENDSGDAQKGAPEAP